MQLVTTPEEALSRLKAGNDRFVAGSQQADPADHPSRIQELAGGQHPFAVILGCADSRVPAELVFDQDLGDLFVIRVAGNIATPTQIGSVEFAIAELSVELVVVLGHSGCGAIQATLDVMANPPADLLPGLGSIVDAIRPAVEAIQETTAADQLPLAAMRENVRQTAKVLQKSSTLLQAKIDSGDLRIIGAEYELATGRVHFFDE